jgi:hypothetical protein
VDAAEPTASTDEDGGSVTEDKEDAVDEGAKGSVEDAEDSTLDVTIEGGPTAAMTLPTSTVCQQCASTRYNDDSRPRLRSICLFSFLIPLVCPCLDLKCPFPP